MNLDEVLRDILFLPEAASAFADRIDHLHFFVITTTMLGSLLVGLFAVVWLVRYRRKDAPSATPHLTAPKWFEISWIGGLLALFILFWVIGFRQYVAYATPPEDAETVYVTGKQWMWKFAHPSGRASVGVLVVPVHQKVRLVMTSRDVIHSFYVPPLRIKQDVLPGRYTTLWFEARREGTFPIYCAEFCGTGHSRMWGSVVVLDAETYGTWIDGEVPDAVVEAGGRAAIASYQAERVGATSKLTMADAGREAAERYSCFSCHTTDGQPHIGPTWKGLFGKTVSLSGGQKVLADEEYLTRSMMDPASDVVEGYRPVMPTYLGTLKQPDAAAIVEFIKSLKSTTAEPLVGLPGTQTNESPDPQKAEAEAKGEAEAEGHLESEPRPMMRKNTDHSPQSASVRPPQSGEVNER